MNLHRIELVSLSPLNLMIPSGRISRGAQSKRMPDRVSGQVQLSVQSLPSSTAKIGRKENA